MQHRLVFHAAAEQELIDIYDYIADQSGTVRAGNFISGIRDHCRSLIEFPQRGTVRDDLRPGLRIIGYRRRVGIAFVVKDEQVIIIGIFYGGRQLTSALLGSRI